jgi:glycosyltransferase involved in cell wall biosynthesis
VSGGGSVQMARMARGLRARGHRVEAVFSKTSWRPGKKRGQGAGVAELEKSGVVCHAFRMQRGLEILPGGGREFRTFLRKQKFDVLHAHKARALRFALGNIGAGSTPEACPLIVAQRGNSYPLDEHTKKLFGDSRVRAVVCVAQEVERLVIEGGIAPEKVVTIYGGVDETEFDFRIGGEGVRREFNIAPNAPVIGLIANYDAKKAHTDFFQVCKILVEKIPDLKILVVGKDMPQSLHEEIHALGLKKNVIITGFRHDIPQVLAALDVSVNCSKSGEGLTGALRESLCMKTPVVCTDVGGNHELVQNDKTGVLISPGDIANMADAIESLLEDRARATTLAENGYALVLQKFTETARIANLEALYVRLLKGENARVDGA